MSPLALLSARLVIPTYPQPSLISPPLRLDTMPTALLWTLSSVSLSSPVHGDQLATAYSITYLLGLRSIRFALGLLLLCPVIYDAPPLPQGLMVSAPH